MTEQAWGRDIAGQAAEAIERSAARRWTPLQTLVFALGASLILWAGVIWAAKRLIVG